MIDGREENTGEIPLSWFQKTLLKFTPLYIELIFLAICLRLIGLVEPFVFQVIIDRILPFQREASLIVVMAIFAFMSLFQLGFQVLSELLGMLTANRVTRELGARIFEHLFKLPFNHFRKWSVGETIARISETDTIPRVSCWNHNWCLSGSYLCFYIYRGPFHALRGFDRNHIGGASDPNPDLSRLRAVSATAITRAVRYRSRPSDSNG